TLSAALPAPPIPRSCRRHRASAQHAGGLRPSPAPAVGRKAPAPLSCGANCAPAAIPAATPASATTWPRSGSQPMSPPWLTPQPPKARPVPAWIRPDPKTLTHPNAGQLAPITASCPQLAAIQTHVQAFAQLMTEPRDRQLEQWITAAHCTLELQSFIA